MEGLLSTGPTLSSLGTINYIDFLLYLIIFATQGRYGQILKEIQVGIGELMILGLLSAHLINIIIKIYPPVIVNDIRIYSLSQQKLRCPSPYVFCRNWAVRNPAGTSLDSSLVIKQVAGREA